MKKLLQRDLILRKKIVLNETKHFILKSIVKNFNFFILIRWNAFLKLKKLTENSSKVAVSSRCLASINRKRFNKLTGFSRHIFLKVLRKGSINGIKKSSW
jgi:ribosomal protein S14